MRSGCCKFTSLCLKPRCFDLHDCGKADGGSTLRGHWAMGHWAILACPRAEDGSVPVHPTTARPRPPP